MLAKNYEEDKCSKIKKVIEYFISIKKTKLLMHFLKKEFMEFSSFFKQCFERVKRSCKCSGRNLNYMIEQKKN